MSNTTPNKEVIRRICILHNATNCYLLVNTGNDYVEVLTDIKTNSLTRFCNEVEAWAGLKFKAYNFSSDNEKIENIKLNGELILPIKL